MSTFSGRLGLVQRVLPSYRVPFFDALSANCEGGLSLFAGLPRPDESIATTAQLMAARHAPAHNLHLFSPSSPFYFCYQRGLTAWLTDWNPDALIVEANFRYLSSPAAIDWMHRHKRPVIGWGLGAPLGRGPLSVLRARFLRRFDALIAYSARGAEQYVANGCPVERVFVAPNAVAPAPTHPQPSRADSFSPQPVVLFVGRLQARKRIASLLNACAALPMELRPRLVIVGDGPELETLQVLARSLYPSAEFVGARRGPQLAPFFQAADLFVLPGTGGLAVQEAMSYGLPVIVAQGDGTQGDLVRPENGWLLPSNDEAALTETLREALSDSGRLRAMGAASYRIVKDEVNLGKMVETFIDVLNKTTQKSL